MAGAARGIVAASILVTGLALASAPPARAQTNAAHDLAQRFATEAEKSEHQKRAREKARIEVLRKQEERDMLARARAEAQARRTALEQAGKAREVIDEARIAAQARQQAEEERRIAAAKAAVLAERLALEKRGREDAARMAEAVRRAAEVRQRAAVLEAEKARVEAHRQRLAEETAAQERRQAELIVQREAQTRRLTEELRAARERRARHDAPSPPSAAAMPVPTDDRPQPAFSDVPRDASSVMAINGATLPRRAALGGPAASVEVAGSQTVAVLIMMQPGDRGIRRHSKTADPLICGAGGCFVSNGPDAEATFLPGHRALGLRRTFSGRAGACKNTLGCIFRGVDLAALHHFVQPIDMRLVRHDRREGHFIETDSSCRMHGPRLACAAPIRSSDYVMWLVPEALAVRVGPAVLEQALWDGLGRDAPPGPVSFR